MLPDERLDQIFLFVVTGAIGWLGWTINTMSNVLASLGNEVKHLAESGRRTDDDSRVVADSVVRVEAELLRRKDSVDSIPKLRDEVIHINHRIEGIEKVLQASHGK